MVTVLLAHADLAEPTVALGNGFTVTTTVFDLLQVVAVTVSVKVYVVVLVGLTLGLACVLVNPVGLLVHE